MRKILLLLLPLVFAAAAVGQMEDLRSPARAKELIIEYWCAASAGRLLTAQGWQTATRFFVRRQPSPGNATIIVLGNNWAWKDLRVDGNSAEMVVEYEEVGKIDSSLRFAPAIRQSGIEGTLTAHHLIFAPSHFIIYGPDGTTVLKDTPGAPTWQIDEPPGWPESTGNPSAHRVPFTTVNTAIVYLLKRREATADANIKRNIDDSVDKLTRFSLRDRND